MRVPRINGRPIYDDAPEPRDFSRWLVLPLALLFTAIWMLALVGFGTVGNLALRWVGML